MATNNKISDDSKLDRDSMPYLSFEEDEQGVMKVSFNDSSEIRSKAPDNLEIHIPNKIHGKSVEIFESPYSLELNVKKLFLPASVKTIELKDGNFMPSLEELVIDKANPVYWTDGKALYSKDTLLRIFCCRLTEYTVANGTKTIENGAFSGCKDLQRVVLPDTMENIKDHTFKGSFDSCSALSEIVGINRVPNVSANALAVTAIEKNSSVLISGKILMKYNENNAKAYSVPDGIEELADSCFSNGNSSRDEDVLDGITLPDSVKKLGNSAFAYRRKLKKIKLSNALESIPKGTFNGCVSLEELNIPASVKEIDISALPRPDAYNITPSAFKNITVNKNNQQYASLDGILYTKDMSTLLFVPDNLKIINFTVPETVTCIHEGAFAFNCHIKKVILPVGLERIEDHAFAHCQAINKIDLSNVKHIGKYAFSDCVSLSSIILNEDMTEISDHSFNGCKMLSSVVLPKKLTRIGASAFDECPSLSSVSFPDSLAEIGEYAFAKCAFKQIVVPKTVQTVHHHAFSYCPDITIYDNLDPHAADCNSKIDHCNGNPNSELGFIGIGKNREGWVWKHAFNSEWVDHVITVRSADTDAVKYKVRMEADSKQRQYYCILTSGWGHNATFAFGEVDKFFPKITGTTIKIKLALSRLQYPVDLSADAEKTYRAYLVRSAKDAVTYCINANDMESLQICVDNGALKSSNIDELIKYTVDNKQMEFTAYLMDYNNSHFANKAKKAPSLGSLPKPKTTKTVDKTSDAYLKKIWTVKDNGDGTGYITRYKGEDTEIEFPTEIGGLKITKIGMCVGDPPPIYSSLTSIVIPEGYTKIGRDAFKNCTKLCSLTLPSTLISIDTRAFYGCSSLKEIALPSALKSIGDGAFSDCSSLKEIALPLSTNSIDGEAFANCSSLETIILPGYFSTPEQQMLSVFKKCTKLKEIYILDPNVNIGFRRFMGHTVHALENAQIKANINGKSNRFVVLTEEEKYSFAKRFYETPVKEPVFCDTLDAPMPKIGDTIDLTLKEGFVYAIGKQGEVYGEVYVCQALVDYLTAKVVSEAVLHKHPTGQVFEIEVKVVDKFTPPKS